MSFKLGHSTNTFQSSASHTSLRHLDFVLKCETRFKYRRNPLVNAMKNQQSWIVYKFQHNSFLVGQVGIQNWK